MSDRELEALRRKKLQELRRLVERKTETKAEPEKPREPDPKEVLNRFFIGRAWEVLNAAKAQYPQAARHIENTLAKLITEGRIKSKITGEELYGLFRRLGLRVRLQTHIRVLEHGKVKSLEEKIKEETSH
jgi:DNA-binding TFAR19-related protein (PDSD5 family)